MRLWKLVPRNLDSDLWKFSTHHRPVIVRAGDEEQARTIAAHRFFGGYQSDMKDRGIVTGYAWYSPTLVTCSEVHREHATQEGELIVAGE
jgi:hypothetical protein